MTRLLDADELHRQAELVQREAGRLLERARELHERHDNAQAADDPIGVQIAEHRLAWIARQLTRAQAVLVHPDDDRWSAAQAVLGYCDEADRAGLWREPAPPPRLGVEAA